MTLLCALLGHKDGDHVYAGFQLCGRCWRPIAHTGRGRHGGWGWR